MKQLSISRKAKKINYEYPVLLSKINFSFGLNHNGRVLIADDMGLGKTFQALAIASYFRKDWPLLIGTTASMRQTWQETIQKYMPTVPLMSIQYMTSAKDYIHDATVLIVSRDMLSRCIDRLVEKKFGVMILVSHELKFH